MELVPGSTQRIRDEVDPGERSQVDSQLILGSNFLGNK